MKDEIKEIYLSNLEWTKTHDNIGGVMGNVVFKDNMPYEAYQKLLKSGYFVLCDKDYITNLQELCDKYEEEHSTTFNYWKQLIKEDYKSRCEKAIEYIKDNLYYCVDNDDTNLINILKGSGVNE